MLTDKKVSRLVRRSVKSGAQGLLGRRAWRRLVDGFHSADPAAYAALVQLAVEQPLSSSLSRLAGTVIADRWVTTRAADLRAIVVRADARGSDGWPNAVTAALRGKLEEELPPDHLGFVLDLL